MKKRIFLLLLLAACFVTALSAQTDSLPPFGGVVLDQAVYSSSGEPEEINRSSPLGGKKSLLEITGIKPFNQRCEASCGACAVVAALMLRYKIYCDGQCNCDTPMHEFSWSYLHNQLVKQYGHNNIHLKDVLDMLKAQGILLVEDFANTPCSHDRLPTAEERKKAAYFKDWTYKPVFRAKKYIPGSSEQKELLFRDQMVPRTIAWIDRDIPVIIGLLVTEDFRHLGNPACLWKAPDPLEGAKGHALLVVGYDDQTREFQLLNSYGISWGCMGVLRIGYEDYSRVVQEGYVLQFDFDAGVEVECPGGRK